MAFTNAFPSDGTPTPTTFIRNCEEVGLFRDLQRVNPFDETFRNATLSTGNHPIQGLEREVRDDNVLNTPVTLAPPTSYLFAGIREPIMPSSTSPKLVDDLVGESHYTVSNAVPVGNSMNIPQGSSEEVENDDEGNTYVLTIPVSSISIQAVDPISIGLGPEYHTITAVPRTDDGCVAHITKPPRATPMNQMLPLQERNLQNNGNENKKRKRRTSISELTDKQKVDIRERNRAAQERCRMRKQEQLQTQEKIIQTMLTENSQLCKMVETLIRDNVFLKMVLASHGDCSVTKNMAEADRKKLLSCACPTEDKLSFKETESLLEYVSITSTAKPFILVGVSRAATEHAAGYPEAKGYLDNLWKRVNDIKISYNTDKVSSIANEVNGGGVSGTSKF